VLTTREASYNTNDRVELVKAKCPTQHIIGHLENGLSRYCYYANDIRRIGRIQLNIACAHRSQETF